MLAEHVLNVDDVRMYHLYLYPSSIQPMLLKLFILQM